ncbi:hypothetical protein GCM10011396_20500 [Undibacterium terreum]|uniref:Uncharacterized protein n=1 Tax=Undibacterium terreum TaxID=1224302 RepID=A0A916UI54_9BURK|nr:hypothetical protein GCM10011396_20500 [Undibacterium terreum]
MRKSSDKSDSKVVNRGVLIVGDWLMGVNPLEINPFIYTGVAWQTRIITDARDFVCVE